MVKKCIIALLVLLLPFFAEAQKNGNQDTLINNLFKELKESWTLGVDSNIYMVNIQEYINFKNLFEINATIDDDLNIQYIPRQKSGEYIINGIAKEFEVYAHDGVEQVFKFRVDSVTSPKKVGTPESMTYEIGRTIYVEKPRKYVLQDIDGLAESIVNNHSGITFDKPNSEETKWLKIALLENLKEKLKRNLDSLYRFNISSTMHVSLIYTSDTSIPVKITNIRIVSKSVTCINDFDMDAVLNREDINDKVYGDFTAGGLPDKDLDGVPDFDDKCVETYGSIRNMGCPDSYFITNNQFEWFVGTQFNVAKINLPGLNKLGYQIERGVNAIDVLQSKKGKLINPGNIISFYGGADYSYFYGKNISQRGISIGIRHTRFTANYGLAEPLVYTYRKFDGVDYYRRQIAINSLREEISYSITNIPVLYNYRFRPEALYNNWIFNVKAGPSFMLLNATSHYNANIDFGGIYQIDTLNQDRIAYYYYFNPTSTWNVYLTRNGINNQNTYPGAATVFAQLKSNSAIYDFAADKNYRATKKLTRATVAVNFSFDGQYKRNNESPVSVKLGVHFVYAPLLGKKERYKPIEGTGDEFNSIFNSSARSSYFAYGANMGLIYNF